MKKTYTILNADGTKQKVKVDSNASILTKRGPVTKVLFGVVFVIFLVYAISLLFPFVFLLINAFKGSLEYINDLNQGNRGTITYKILAPNDVEIKRGGSLLEETANVSEYKIYTIATPLTAANNALDLTIEKDGNTYNYTQALGGKATTRQAADCTAAEFSKESVTPTFTLTAGNTVDSSLSGQVAKIDLPATTDGTEQSFRIAGNLVNGVGEKTAKFIMRVYYAGSDEVKFIISAKHKKAMLYYDLTSVTLKPGMNEIIVPLGAKNWSSLGEIEYLAVYLGEKAGEPARSLYFVENVIYDK